jgi:SAM-dependent methyltransferase
MTHQILGITETGACQFCGSSYSGSAWNLRYQQGGSSGTGSMGELGRYKAAMIDGFIVEYRVKSVIDFGCGEGLQLGLFQTMPKYIGLDVSPVAVQRCIDKFKWDINKSFYLFDPLSFHDQAGLFRADLALSLDVVYHLIDDHVFNAYLARLFDAADRFVIIYSSDFDQEQNLYERRRAFSEYVEQIFLEWKLKARIPNEHPFDTAYPEQTSHSNWFIYERRTS